MDALTGFSRASDRVQRLIDAHGVLHGGGRGRPAQQAADVLRGAVVLAVAALDAFVNEVFIEALPPLAKAGRLGPAAHNVADQRAYLHMISTADPIAEFTRLARIKFATKTFQRSGAIAAHLQENLGYAVDWGDVASKLGLATGPGASALLDKYVLRRNDIAHAGDVPAGVTKATAINRPYVERCLETTRATAESISLGLDAYI